jgi:hypothetical protein
MCIEFVLRLAAWSKYLMVLPIRDKTLPTVIACLHVTPRRFVGAPTHGLSDNEKTLTLDHSARIAVRHPTMVEVGQHDGLTLASFLEVAGPVLDLYACRWQGQPLWADEYVLSADQETSIQARRRVQPTLSP